VHDCLLEVGQHSRIHNHRDQNAGCPGPIGRLRVRIFAWIAATLLAALSNYSTDTYDLDPRIRLRESHEPGPRSHESAEFKQRAVSIHILFKPFDSCEVYLRTGHLSDVPLFYTADTAN